MRRAAAVDANQSEIVEKLRAMGASVYSVASLKNGFDIPEIIIETPQNREFGDYSTNVAMQIAKLTKINPHKVAGILTDYLRGDFDVEPLPA